MNVLYISSAVSENYFEKISADMVKTKNLYGMPVAGNKFHTLVMKGLKDKSNVTSLSIRPFSRATNDKSFYAAFREKSNDGIIYKYSSIINIPVIKNLWNGIACFGNVLAWSLKTKGEKVIIYDASYVSILPFMSLSSALARVKKIAVFMDIYDYMADVDVKNANASGASALIRKIVKGVYNSTDKYVFLSEQMNTLINKKNKPYYVMEGIVDSSMVKYIDEVKENDNKFTFMYAGALKKEYGLEILVKGFMKVSNPNAELWIFGAGDYAEDIKQYQKEDKRICFYGAVSNLEVLRYEKKADVLVNPRPSKQLFAQYSFPSKLMEYMSSGTATLTTKLPTIPDEYNSCMYYILDESEEGIKNSMETLIDLGKEEVSKYGMQAREYVLKNKNEMRQGSNILRGI